MSNLRLKDIAKLAYVSTATVARVLKNKGYVSADKREISYDSEIGYAAMERLLDSAEERPTAVFISSDMLAIGVLRCLYDRNVRVPEDLSIIGFDDTYSGILSPRISTMAIPIRELGRTAAGMILDRIQGGAAEAEDRIVTIPTRYIDRGSVKDLKA